MYTKDLITVLQQIEAAITPAQIKAIATMQLTMQNMPGFTCQLIKAG